MNQEKVIPTENEKIPPANYEPPAIITGFKKGDIVHYHGLACTVLHVTEHSITLRPASGTAIIKGMAFRFSKMVNSGDLVLVPVNGSFLTRPLPEKPVTGHRCTCGALITPNLGVCGKFKPSRRSRLKCAYCGHAESCHTAPTADPGDTQP